MFRSVVFLLLLVAPSTCSETAALTIAGAAHLRAALTELTADFTRQTGIRTELVFASSGKLTAQIKAGAPYNVFLSADERYPRELTVAGLTTGNPIRYATGKLVLWTNRNDVPLHPDSLSSPTFGRIALPNPATAPYGRVARHYLEKRNLYGAIEAKLVFGQSITQSDRFVHTGAAEVGFSALAAVAGRVDTDRYREIPGVTVLQEAVGIRPEGPGKDPAAFLRYLCSPAARAILRKYGLR